MAHKVEVTEEQYIFRSETRKKLYTLLITGLVVFAIGFGFAIKNEGKESEGGEHGHGHHSSLAAKEMVATSDHVAASEGHAEEGHAAAGHHESPTWKKRLFTSLWQNNMFFTGLGLIGLFFVAIQYAAQAGWSAGGKRVSLRSCSGSSPATTSSTGRMNICMIKADLSSIRSSLKKHRSSSGPSRAEASPYSSLHGW
jgi:hypothetical protein